MSEDMSVTASGPPRQGNPPEAARPRAAVGIDEGLVRQVITATLPFERVIVGRELEHRPREPGWRRAVSGADATGCDPPGGAGVLALHPDRVHTLLHITGLVHDQHPLELGHRAIEIPRARERVGEEPERPEVERRQKFQEDQQKKREQTYELMDQGKATYKQDERRRFYQQIDEVVQQEAIDTPLYVASSLEAMSTSVQGYQPNLLGKPVFRGVWLQAK